MMFKSFTLDKFQEDAANAIKENKSVIVSAPTGSGKTLIADYIIDREIKKDKKVIYTAPIKALSNQKYKDFCADYGEENIGIITGDIVLNSNAKVLIMTTEVYRNMAIVNDPILNDVSYCIMDEIHYIGDSERGYVWEESIIFSSNKIRFLFLSATIPNAKEFADWVSKIKNHSVEVVKHHIRAVPLDIQFYTDDTGICSLEKIKNYEKEFGHLRYPNKKKKKNLMPNQKLDYIGLVREISSKKLLPCIYFVFSRQKTVDYGYKLSLKNDYLNSDEKKEMTKFISVEFNNLNPQVKSLQSVYALRQCLSKGIAFHHAGMVPDMKHIVEKLFSKGLIKVLFATETFAVGINMPAKTVCFDGLRKFTNEGFRYLNSKEFFQISGRAGRRGIDTFGLSVSVINKKSDDFKKIAFFTKEDVLPIISQFKLSYNTILNMLIRHNQNEINTILKMNFYTYQQLKGKTDEKKVLISIMSKFKKSLNFLRKAGYVEEYTPTYKGMFASKIYSNEIDISELFSTELKDKLDVYSIILIMLSIVYEHKRQTKFLKKYPDQKMNELKKILNENKFLFKSRWSKNIIFMTSISKPLFDGLKFTEILENTNLQEGDLIRLLMQVLDKLEQINKATDDYDLKDKISHAKFLIKSCLEGINVL
jgi:ATP-dependent RNA helicase DOB1